MKEEVEAWCREGKENRVGEGFVSSPRTVRKPLRLSSSISKGCSWERMPTSRREGEVVLGLVIERWVVDEGKKAESVRAWDIVSKDMSRVEASEREETRAWHALSVEGHSLRVRYVWNEDSEESGE